MRFHSSFAILGLFAATLAAQAPAGQASPQAAREPGLYATIKTSMGDIILKMYETETPITVKNFVDLSLGRRKWKNPKTGAWSTGPMYTGTTFHRVIKGFMIQGGDPRGDGTGDIGFTIKDEFLPTLNFHGKGRLAMANIGSPNTGAGQFFITVAATPHLNGQHTIFGQVVQGQEIADKISLVPVRADERPVTPVRIVAITFQREGPAPANDVLKGAAPAKKAAPSTKKAAPPPPKKK